MSVGLDAAGPQDLADPFLGVPGRLDDLDRADAGLRRLDDGRGQAYPGVVGPLPCRSYPRRSGPLSGRYGGHGTAVVTRRGLQVHGQSVSVAQLVQMQSPGVWSKRVVVRLALGTYGEVTVS